MTLSLCRAELTPLSESNGAVELEIFAVLEVAFQIKVVVNRRVNSGEFPAGFSSAETAASPVLVVETAGANFRFDCSASGRFPASVHCL
jgi:hypothetical protein